MTQPSTSEPRSSGAFQTADSLDPGLQIASLPSPHLGLSYLGQVELPPWAGPEGQWRLAQGAEVAAGAGAERRQGLQEAESGAL